MIQLIIADCTVDHMMLDHVGSYIVGFIVGYTLTVANDRSSFSRQHSCTHLLAMGGQRLIQPIRHVMYVV